jgi:hypothetical protein
MRGSISDVSRVTQSFPSPAQRERVASGTSAFTRVFDALWREPGEGELRAKSTPLPPSLRSGTLSRKRERGSAPCGRVSSVSQGKAT